jgi:hypothetical protein
VKFLEDRRRVIEGVQRHSSVGQRAGEEAVTNARRLVGELAATVLFYAQTAPTVVRWYCRLRRYRLGLAGLSLNGLHDRIGEASSDALSDQADGVRVCLGATGMMSGDRQGKIRRMLLAAEGAVPREN